MAMNAPNPFLGAFMAPYAGGYNLPQGFAPSGMPTSYGGPQTGTSVLPGGLGQQSPPSPSMWSDLVMRYGPGTPPLGGPQPIPNPIMGAPSSPGDIQWLGAGTPGGVLPAGLGGAGPDTTFTQALTAMQQSPTGYGAPPITPTQPYGATPSVLPPQLATGAVPSAPGTSTPAAPAAQPQAPAPDQGMPTWTWGPQFQGGPYVFTNPSGVRGVPPQGSPIQVHGGPLMGYNQFQAQYGMPQELPQGGGGGGGGDRGAPQMGMSRDIGGPPGLGDARFA
jgi:hypothetical protein